MIFYMDDFNVILGLTWSSPHYDVLDSNTNVVTLEIQGREKLELEEVYKPNQVKIIFSIRASKIVEQGCLAYSACVRDIKMDVPSIRSIMVVYEFSEVLPNDLSGMPPDRDIDFCIDLYPHMRFISINLYHMTPMKLR